MHRSLAAASTKRQNQRQPVATADDHVRRPAGAVEDISDLVDCGRDARYEGFMASRKTPLSRTRLLMPVAVLSAGLAAPAVGSAAADPKPYVLQRADLPGWVIKKTETTPATGAGIFGSYGVLYQNPGVLRGLIQVDSKAAIFGSEVLAHQAMTLVYARPHGYRRVSAAWRIGDESALFEQSKIGATGDRLIVYLVVWRSRTVLGIVFGGGIRGTFHARNVVALARRQQARIARLPH